MLNDIFRSIFWSELIGMMVPLATLVTSIAALWTIKEQKKARIESNKAEIIIEGSSLRLDWLHKGEDAINALKKTLLSDKLTNKFAVLNVGNGIAKNARIDFDFDQEIINKINIGSSGVNEHNRLLKILMSQKDVNGFFLKFELSNGFNFLIHPKPEIQFTPSFSHQKKILNFIVSERAELAIPSFFQYLCYVYGICLAEYVIDNYNYKPKLLINIQHQDVYNNWYESKFELICRIAHDGEDGSVGSFIDFIYEVEKTSVIAIKKQKFM